APGSLLLTHLFVASCTDCRRPAAAQTLRAPSSRAHGRCGAACTRRNIEKDHGAVTGVTLESGPPARASVIAGMCRDARRHAPDHATDLLGQGHLPPPRWPG